MVKVINIPINNYSLTLHKMIGNNFAKDKFENLKTTLNYLEIDKTLNNKKSFRIEDI